MHDPCTSVSPAKSLRKPHPATQGVDWCVFAWFFVWFVCLFVCFVFLAVYLIAVAVHGGCRGHCLQVGGPERRHSLQRSAEPRRGKIESGSGAVFSGARYGPRESSTRHYSAEPTKWSRVQL